MKRRIALAAGVLAVVLAAVAAGIATVGLPPTDLRPTTVSLADDPAAEARGRALLQLAFEAHGGPELARHLTWTVQMRDTWVGPARLFNPWPHADQRLTMTAKVHSFDSRVELHNGPEAGVTWGITNGRTWRLREGERTEAPDPDIAFMLPTAHYFVEMPQRLTEAGIVRHVGTETVGGTAYDVVYATWGSVAANPEYDQYRIYLDPRTHLLAKVHYTVREVAPFATGVCHFGDVHEIDGYRLAFEMTVTDGVDPDASTVLHTMRITDLAFDR